MNKRSTQLSLPLSIEGKEIKEIVRQHWNITFSRQGKISVIGKRIMGLVLGQIQDNDMKLKPYYQITASDVMTAADLKGESAYSRAKKALDELVVQFWAIEDEEKEIYRPKQLINTSTIESKDGFEYGYKDGLITVVINPALEPYFIGMAHYSKFELNHYMKFKSWYSMRIWEILSAWRDKEYWIVDIPEFRKLMDCESKYPLTKDLINRTLTEPLEELKGTDLEFTVEKISEQTGGRGRKPISHIKLVFVNPAKTPKQILEEWQRHPKFDERHARLLSEGREKWKINDEHLVKHLPQIGKDAFAELLDGFRQKQQSQRKMDNVKKYCNAAFLKLAEK